MNFHTTLENRGCLTRGSAILMLAALPSFAFAEVCDKVDPSWEGTAVSAFQELISLAATPPALVLLIATAFAVRFKHQWGALAVVVLWTIYASLLTMFDPTGLRGPAMAEGCVGSPVLFIAAVAAICVGVILYTVPRPKDPT